MENQNQQTLYDILGVPKTATNEEIKRAYHKKAFQLHPDRNKDDPQATEKFQQLGEAHSILKDPEQREKYDKFGINGETPTENEDFEVLDLIAQILGLGKPHPRGDKLTPTVRFFRFSLKEVYLGLEASNRISVNIVCSECHGKGSNDDIDYPECPTCHGSGTLSPMLFQNLFPCPQCNGLGYMIPSEKICLNCHGHKVVRNIKEIKLKAEVGQEENEKIILKNQGDEYPGKITADLVLITQMKFDFQFTREGDDLLYVKKVSRIEAMKGTAFIIV